MQTTADHLNLAPPRQGRWLGPLGLALVAHGLLVAALTWGVGWKKDSPPVVFEAEIWSRVPQQAAPRVVETPRPPPPEPKPEPRPAPPPPAPVQADIATQQAKQQAEADQRELEKQAAAKKAAAEKAAAEKRALADKQLAEQKREQARKEADEKRLAQLREDQIRRMMGQAGASGGPQATGTAQQSSGPSATYAGRVAARIKPNVVFTDMVTGNPRAEVEVRTLPDGTITARRIVKPSGSPAWDEAVLRAIDRTATLPRDTDGRVPVSLIIGLRPLD